MSGHVLRGCRVVAVIEVIVVRVAITSTLDLELYPNLDPQFSAMPHTLWYLAIDFVIGKCTSSFTALFEISGLDLTHCVKCMPTVYSPR